jgi:glycerol-3-phosphate acyltransferase PlsY
VPLVAVVVVFLAVAAWTRHISLGSIVAAATFPLAAWLIAQASWPVLGAAVLAAALVIYRHRSNIQRLRKGSEHTFNLGARRG